jgi:hypothetical protein
MILESQSLDKYNITVQLRITEKLEGKGFWFGV